MPILLPLLLSCAPQAPNWTLVPLPSLCSELPTGRSSLLLAGGAHIETYFERESAGDDAEAEIAPGMLVQILEGEARRLAPGLSLLPTAPPLLLSGSPEEIAWAQATVAGLDATGRRLEIDIEARLVPGVGAEAAEGARLWTGRVRSGRELQFGAVRDQRLAAD